MVRLHINLVYDVFSMRKFDKTELLQLVVAEVASDLETVTASQQAAVEGVTHEDARAEGDKDMRSTEASYVARGLARRAEELQIALRKLGQVHFSAGQKIVGLGALVELEDHDSETVSYLFLLPDAGGKKVQYNRCKVTVVTPTSPLGKSLVGKELDDDIAVRTPQGVKEKTIIGLQ